MKAWTAKSAGLVGCHVCDRLHAGVAPGEGLEAVCSRCGARLHSRKADSLNRSLALLVAALTLYVPANLYPIMSVFVSGNGSASTILGGVLHLLESGSYVIGLLILFASVVVPLAKILSLMWLVLSVKRKSSWRPRERTVFYRVVEGLGRWSMIDVFVVAILVAIVQLGSIATIEPGVGATAFSGVVVVTMFAAESFDPRLIWDSMEETST